MIKYVNNDFFYRGTWKKFQVTPEIKFALKNLKHRFYDGAYVDKGLSWDKLDNDFLENYTKRFTTETLFEDKQNIFLNNVAIAMQLIVRTIRLENIDPEYIEEKGIKNYHIDLLNNLYIDNDEDGLIETGDKRPFGNSYFIGDIKLAMKVYDDENDEYYERYNSVYHDVLDLVLYIFKRDIPFSSFIFSKAGLNLSPVQKEYYNHNWTIDLSEIRDKRIDSVLND